MSPLSTWMSVPIQYFFTVSKDKAKIATKNTPIITTEFGRNEMIPIFIFSLPRSGSTLLQKIIASSDKVDTASEPWLLLPILYSQKETGIVTEYSHEHSLLALDAVRDKLCAKGVDYDNLVREYVEKLYEGLSKSGTKYFLDKTPRYYLIIEEILRTFPNAKVIFLFRNPLSQLASHLQIHGGRIRTMYFNAIDIFFGHKLLADGYKTAGSKSLKLTYEELVSDTEEVRRRLNEFLDLTIESDVGKKINSVKLSGQLGDPGLLANNIKEVNEESLSKWKVCVNSLVRKILVRKYLMSIDEAYFEYLGYSRNRLLSDLAEIKVRRLVGVRDCFDMLYCWTNMKFQMALNFSPKNSWSRFKRLS